MALPPSVEIIEVQGTASVFDPGVDKSICVIGCAEETGNQIAQFGSAEALYNARGEGPGVRLLGHVLKANPNALIGTLCQVEASTPGAFGTPNTDNKDGTCVMNPAGTPPDYYEFEIEFVDGGTVGTNGITYRKSNDYGEHPSGLLNLGTDTSIAFDNVGDCSVALDPPTTELLATVNDVRAQVLAHFAEGSLIHTTADITSGASIGSAATNLATAITRTAQILAALKLHSANLSYHGAADSTFTTALDAIVSPTTGQETVTAINAIKTAYNAHHTRTTSSIHGAGTDTHTVTADAAIRGTVVAGDVWRCKTTAPYPDSTEMGDAFTALKESTAKYCILAIASEVDATMAAVLKTGLTTLAAKGKRVLCVYPVANPGVDSEETWVAALASDFDGFEDDRQTAAACPAICTFNDGNSTITLHDANALANILAKVMSFERPSIAWNDVSKGALDGVKLHDSDGVLTHHDEDGGVQGLDAARFMTLRTIPEDTYSGQVFVTRAKTMRGTNSKIPLAQIRMVANKAERIANARSWGNIGNGLVYRKINDSSGILSDSVRSMMASVLRGDLSAALKNDISNPNDKNLVEIDQNVTVVEGEIQMVVYLNVAMLGYIGKITLNLAVK